MTPDAVFSHPLFTFLALLVWGGMSAESLWLLYRYRLSLPWGEQAANVFILIVGGALRISVRGVFLVVFVAVSMRAPVHWEDSMRYLLSSGISKFYEIGPGKVLKGLLKRIDRKVECENIG